VQITIINDQDLNVTLSDNGAGGIFSASTASLNVGNGYTTSITYTPNSIKNLIITVTGSGQHIDIPLMSQPYTTTIGYIGDSITDRNVYIRVNSHMPAGPNNRIGVAEVINKAVAGSSTTDWVNDTLVNGRETLTGAKTAFSASGVEIVSLMFGRNDTTQGTLSGVFKTNIQTLIDDLKTIGIKHIILNCPIYATIGGDHPARLQEYCIVLSEIVDENPGYAVMGDTTAFGIFENDIGLLDDGTHPTIQGYLILANIWAGVISSFLDDYITPNAYFLSGDTYTKGTS
jgi:lysophospholipase L1-like esterase